MPTRQSTFGSPRCARDDSWVGGFAMSCHTLPATAFIVEISSLRGVRSPTRQSTYGSPRCARDDDGLQPLLLILQKPIFFLPSLRGDIDEAIRFTSAVPARRYRRSNPLMLSLGLGSPRVCDLRDDVHS